MTQLSRSTLDSDSPPPSNPTQFRTFHFDQVPRITQPPSHLGIDHKPWVHICREHQIPSLIDNTHNLQAHVANKDTASLWTTIFQIMEHGVLTGSEATKLKGNKGRGKARRRCQWSMPRLTSAQADLIDFIPSTDPKMIVAKARADELNVLDFKANTMHRRTQ